jgi:DNA-binding CsgD family transcriptional regulator
VHSVLSDATVLGLVERIYGAGCDPAEWHGVTEDLYDRLPGIAFSTHLVTPEISLVGLCAGIADEHVESYLAHYHALNPYVPLFETARVGRVFTPAEHGGRGWIKRHPFFHEWLKPAGNFTCGAGAVLARDAHRLMRVTFDVPEALEHLEDTCVLLLKKLVPHMARAFEVNERLQAAVATETALGGMLDRIDGAAFMLGAPARVLALNRRGENLARAGRLIRIKPTGQLTFRDAAAEAGFRQALALALGAIGDDVPMAFAMPEGATATVLPLRPAATGAAQPVAEPRALLVVRRPGAAGASLPGDLLKALYRLTRAETEVVLRIASGASVADAADALGVTRTTARNQLCAAMAKVGVHRQSELAATVAGLAPRLRLDRDS